MAGLTETQIKVMTDAEMRQSAGYFGGKLSEMRRKAEYYFLGLAKGDLAPPEIEGRSTVVDTTVRNTILWMQPTLIKTFCAGDSVVEFTPTSEDDEEKAKLATDYINYIFYKQNPGFQIVSTWFTDALLQKVGVLKVWWDNRVEETREEYKGLDDVALSQVMEDDEVEAIEHKQYEDEDAAEQKRQALAQAGQKMQQTMAAAKQGDRNAAQVLPQMQQAYAGLEAAPVPMLHDVTFKRTKKSGRVRIDNVPPEEFLISKKAKSLADATFVAHRVMRTISDLKAMGYDNVDDIQSDDQASMMSMERVERNGFDDETPYLNQENVSTDPSQRIVWITECYMKADVNGDGIAEWRKICRAGNQILENVECDGHPFVSITPIPLPHRFFGLSIADLSMEPQRIKTSLLRAELDNTYLQVNGRYFAVEGQVNLDDLLTSRPGGVVRVKQPGAVGRLDQAAADLRSTENLREWFDTYTENATGWTKNSQGGNSNALNQTATGINIITNRADMRIELIARTFAETGFTDLFKLILKLVGQHQDKSSSIKLGNKWVNIDPREWRNQFDLTINVGLGTGNKDQQVQHLMTLIQNQRTDMQVGVATPKNIYNSNVKLAESLGFKNGDMYFTDPSAPPGPNTPPKPPPAPDPHMIQAQQKDQQHQREMQFKQQESIADRQHQAQIAQLKAQFDTQVENAKQEAQAQQRQQELQQEAQLAQLKAQFASQHEVSRIDLERWKAQLQSDTQIYIAQMAAQSAQQVNTNMALTMDRSEGEQINGN